MSIQNGQDGYNFVQHHVTNLIGDMETKIYVFETSVQSVEEVQRLKTDIEHLQEIKQWSFDLSDPDFTVFRVEMIKNISTEIIAIFKRFDLKCIPLDPGRKIQPRREYEDEYLINSKSFRAGVTILLISGILFWIGAVTPPYRQWTAIDVTEYLAIIYNNMFNWYIMHIAFILGIIGTFIGLLFCQAAFYSHRNKVWILISSNIYGMGAALAIITFAFRLTVTQWAAKQLLAMSEDWAANFETWMAWSNLLFAIYMMAGYFACFCFGLALNLKHMIPRWVAKLYILFGLCALLLYPFGFLLFEPPLMIHFPFIVGSIGVLRHLKARARTYKPENK
jgi:hypothetical protein